MQAIAYLNIQGSYNLYQQLLVLLTLTYMTVAGDREGKISENFYHNWTSSTFIIHSINQQFEILKPQH